MDSTFTPQQHAALYAQALARAAVLRQQAPAAAWQALGQWLRSRTKTVTTSEA